MARSKARPSTIGTRSQTRQAQRRKTDPSYPPNCEPRSSFPLPPELTKRILFFASEPTITFDHRERTFKYAELRNLGHPPTDIQNARLVCRTFSELGAPFLFNRLWISADHSQLAHVKHVAQHPHLSKAVRHLVYDSSTFTNDSSDRGIPEKSKATQKRLFHDQEEILLGELDTQCLLTALPSLTAVTKATYKPHSPWHHNHNPGLQSPDRASCPPPDTEARSSHDHRPLYNLLAALTALPTHNVRTLDLTFHIDLLRDAAAAPARFSTLLAALAPVTNLSLAVVTAPPPPHPDDRSAAAAADDDHPYKTLLRTGALGHLVGAARALHRLKLNLSPDGRRRSAAVPHRFSAPLAAYVGPAATDGRIWPGLRYLYLGSVDVGADELAGFVAARGARLECVEFDRCALARGQWAAVGAAVELGCRRLRWMKQNRLTQVEPRAATVEVPREVVEAARAEGRDDVPVEVEAEGIYFQATDEMSTIFFGGWDEE